MQAIKKTCSPNRATLDAQSILENERASGKKIWTNKTSGAWQYIKKKDIVSSYQPNQNLG